MRKLSLTRVSLTRALTRLSLALTVFIIPFLVRALVSTTQFGTAESPGILDSLRHPRIPASGLAFVPGRPEAERDGDGELHEGDDLGGATVTSKRQGGATARPTAGEDARSPQRVVDEDDEPTEQCRF